MKVGVEISPKGVPMVFRGRRIFRRVCADAVSAATLREGVVEKASTVIDLGRNWVMQLEVQQSATGYVIASVDVREWPPA